MSEKKLIIVIKTCDASGVLTHRLAAGAQRDVAETGDDDASAGRVDPDAVGAVQQQPPRQRLQPEHRTRRRETRIQNQGCGTKNTR